jgi:methyl-accepting chemotaxis protein
MTPDRGGGMSFRTSSAISVILIFTIPALVVGIDFAIGMYLYGLTLRNIEPAGYKFLVVTIIIFTAASGFLYWAWSNNTNQVRRRLRMYVQYLNNIADGSEQSRLPVSGNDELTQLSSSINTLLDQRDTYNPQVSDAMTLQGQIEKLLQEVSAVGEGDLTVQAEVTPDTLGVLADSFNYMIEELAKLVGRVQMTTQQVTIATQRIRDRAIELTRKSELQNQQLGMTAEKVEELAAFIIQASRNATLSANAAQEALTNARTGKEAVARTIERMQLIRENVQETSKKIKRLGERSQEISDIVRIIEDLAEQTNLLALNAALQSAMAGENGRGFTVVADEIRLLAERSSDAAKKVVALVTGIQSETHEVVIAMEESTTEVVQGAATADDAGRALEDILIAVDLQANMIEDIAQAAEMRTQTSDAVTMAMTRIAEVTNQTNITMSDTARSVAYLTELAEQLRSSIATFKIPVQVGTAPAPFGGNVSQTGGMGGAPRPPMIGTPGIPPGYGPPAGMPALPPAGYRPSQSGQFPYKHPGDLGNRPPVGPQPIPSQYGPPPAPNPYGPQSVPPSYGPPSVPRSPNRPPVPPQSQQRFPGMLPMPSGDNSSGSLGSNYDFWEDGSQSPDTSSEQRRPPSEPPPYSNR